MMAMAAGRGEDGFLYPQHHPKATFDEAALTAGCAAYAYTALRWLSDHQ
jgi:hippurate hydrolase